jgi:hypothetical protein
MRPCTTEGPSELGIGAERLRAVVVAEQERSAVADSAE